ncbi:unnamed protein product [Lactuca saligna]|uniref:Uncharacterized protein n=1 Tax=Lactuca saligna TaxID=75948 RepID=A0AA35VJ00_LACSI|nr:unnamed protein product [Lactuca saligna]
MVSRVSGMIRDSESRILEKVDHTDQTAELRINSFNLKYVGAVKELTNVQKERHTLFIMDVKKLREDVILKLQELRDDMVREVAVVQNDYATLYKEVDIICDAVTKYVTLYETLSPQITQLSTIDNQQFGESRTVARTAYGSLCTTTRIHSQPSLHPQLINNLIRLTPSHPISSTLF